MQYLPALLADITLSRSAKNTGIEIDLVDLDFENQARLLTQSASHGLAWCLIVTAAQVCDEPLVLN